MAWSNESARHSAARYGIKTSTKTPSIKEYRNAGYSKTDAFKERTFFENHEMAREMQEARQRYLKTFKTNNAIDDKVLLQDSEDLRAIQNDFILNKPKEAIKKIHNLDTVVRDYLPVRVVRKAGYQVAKENKNKKWLY
jgi:hypothetical protein